MLELEKSLVYMSTSLRANDVTLKKIFTGKVIRLYEDDQDLLDDVLIESNQAIEMASIYTGILSGMMDAFASVISNNLNIVMKVLTSVTIMLTIPNIVFGFYGMNVGFLPGATWWIPLCVAAVIVFLVWILLKRRDLI
jgi:magnesium transporter